MCYDCFLDSQANPRPEAPRKLTIKQNTSYETKQHHTGLFKSKSSVPGDGATAARRLMTHLLALPKVMFFVLPF